MKTPLAIALVCALAAPAAAQATDPAIREGRRWVEQERRDYDRGFRDDQRRQDADRRQERDRQLDMQRDRAPDQRAPWERERARRH